MQNSRNTFLITGAVLSALAALLHVGCILFGASWYRFFGAGERMVRMAAAGRWYPTVITSGIVAILSCWSLYALSGAGVVRRLPLVRPALCLIAGSYLLRAVAFAPFHKYFPGNSATFWLWSSAVCFVIGLVHLVGLWQAWPRLRPTAAQQRHVPDRRHDGSHVPIVARGGRVMPGLKRGRGEARRGGRKL